MASMLLPNLLSEGLPSSTAPPLVVISDSLLQPGIHVLRQLISTALSKDTSVVLIPLECTPSRLLPSNHDPSSVDLINNFAAPFPFASSSKDKGLAAVDGLKQLQSDVQDAAKKRKAAGVPVLVVVDAVDELATFGVPAVFAFLKSVLRELEGTSGSSLALIHHNHFPSLPSTSTSASLSLLSTLLSPSISSSTIHLTLFPSLLLELFSRDYGLVIPLDPSDPIDVRLHSFLSSFASRSWGDPFIRPASSRQEDERIPLDLGGKECGVCVVEWSARGVTMPSSGRLKQGEARKIVSRGLEGLRKTVSGVEGVALRKVLRPEKMASTTITAASLPTQPKAAEPALPFNLSLTASQKEAREGVVLPYLAAGAAEIEYVPDELDDMDDDDPDEDLEI